MEVQKVNLYTNKSEVEYPLINTCQVSSVRKASNRIQEVLGSIITGCFSFSRSFISNIVEVFHGVEWCWHIKPKMMSNMGFSLQWLLLTTLTGLSSGEMFYMIIDRIGFSKTSL